MTSKYYYKTPLEAAFMAKYHGIIFEENWDFATLIMMYDNDRKAPVDAKIYVHADSLHLFDLQHGDIIISERGHPDIQAGNSEYNGRKVVMRNDIHFFWPETDECANQK